MNEKRRNMVVTADLFDGAIGMLIKKCQCIEHDVKIMYAGMLCGDFNTNLDKVIDLPLGPVLKKLENLDYSDNSPYLSRDDYSLLNEIKDIRNYWVHKGYIDFLYGSIDGYQNRIEKQYNELSSVVNRLIPLAKQLEDVRIKMMKHYGRV